MSTPHSFVVGGGISGLFAACCLIDKGHRVTLLERGAEVGGLLRSFDYGAWGRFDYGAHNLAETGVAELDALLYGLLPESEWQVLDGNRRDIGGNFFNGRVHAGSVYPDLRSCPDELYKSAIAGFFDNLDRGKPGGRSDARSFLADRFGVEIESRILSPVLRKLYGRESSELDVFAAMLTPLDRVVLFGEELTLDLYRSETMRRRIAYPEQRTLPLELSSGRRSFYPRNYGMYRIVDAMRARIEAASGSIFCDAAVDGLDLGSGRVASISYSRGEAAHATAVTGMVVWTTGWPSLAALCGCRVPAPPDRPSRTVLVNLLLDRPLKCEDLYYFYCYDAGYRTFRLTNYSAYCEGAKRAGGYPICLETLVDPLMPFDSQEVLDRALQELFAFGITAPGAQVLFSRVEHLHAGFPMPSLKNVGAILAARSAVSELGLANLRVAGSFADAGVFFQKDVLMNVFKTLVEAPG